MRSIRFLSIFVSFIYVPDASWVNTSFENTLQPSVAFHIETSHLSYSLNQMTCFYVKYNTGKKLVNIVFLLLSLLHGGEFFGKPCDIMLLAFETAKRLVKYYFPLVLR